MLQIGGNKVSTTTLEIQYADSNHNIKFVQALFSTIHALHKESYWAVGNLDLVPKFHGDYHPTGKSTHPELSYHYYLRVQNEWVVFSTLDELQAVFLDTETVHWGAFLCFANDVAKDKEIHPFVEAKPVDNLQHPLALLEIRILDGDLFILLSKDRSLLDTVKETLASAEWE